MAREVLLCALLQLSALAVFGRGDVSNIRRVSHGCLEVDVDDLEKYLSTMNLADVPSADAMSSGFKCASSLPFGVFRSDWSRLLLLRDRQPEGSILREKLARLLRVLVIAYQRVELDLSSSDCNSRVTGGRTTNETNFLSTNHFFKAELINSDEDHEVTDTLVPTIDKSQFRDGSQILDEWTDFDGSKISTGNYSTSIRPRYSSEKADGRRKCYSNCTSTTAVADINANEDVQENTERGQTEIIYYTDATADSELNLRLNESNFSIRPVVENNPVLVSTWKSDTEDDRIGISSENDYESTQLSGERNSVSLSITDRREKSSVIDVDNIPEDYDSATVRLNSSINTTLAEVESSSIIDLYDTTDHYDETPVSLTSFPTIEIAKSNDIDEADDGITSVYSIEDDTTSLHDIILNPTSSPSEVASTTTFATAKTDVDRTSTENTGHLARVNSGEDVRDTLSTTRRAIYLDPSGNASENPATSTTKRPSADSSEVIAARTEVDHSQDASTTPVTRTVARTTKKSNIWRYADHSPSRLSLSNERRRGGSRTSRLKSRNRGSENADVEKYFRWFYALRGGRSEDAGVQPSDTEDFTEIKCEPAK